MKKVWDKIADIATWIFIIFIFGTLIILTAYLIIDLGICLWNWNKFVFSLYILFLVSGVISGIDLLIRCIHD